MQFSKLKASWKDLNQSNIGIEEINRQQLNLSLHARSVLLQDVDAFYHQLHIEPGSNVIGSAVINHILRNFREDADASIYLACQKRRKQWSEDLKSLDSTTSAAVIPLLEEAFRQSITEQIRQDLFRKGENMMFRINRKNLELLATNPYPDWDGSSTKPERGFYLDKVGNYLKALIEEYARKPYFEREEIFCKDVLVNAQKAIHLGLMLRITTRNQYVQYVRPYVVQGDSEQLYHYLAGYLAPGPDGPWSLGSVRLSGITDCTVYSESSEMDKAQIAELDAAIRKKGIQFLSDTAQQDLPRRIVVEFTEYGKRMYHRMLHLRPMYDGKPNGLIYQFTITPRQAENYFFKFGHNVKILEPQELADKFRRSYESAAKQYQ